MASEVRAPVFPAHAGMSPLVPWEALQAQCFPRSRGDEPAGVKVLRFAGEFSPLTRG